MSRKQDACPHCGCLLAKPRSLPDHRRLFSVFAKAYDQWPESHAFQPSSAEQLRAFILVEVGYAETTPIFADLDCFPEGERSKALKLVSLAVEAAITAAVGQGSYAFARVTKDAVNVSRPRSMSFAQLGQREFGPLRDAVEDYLEATLKVTVEQLLREQAA